MNPAILLTALVGLQAAPAPSNFDDTFKKFSLEIKGGRANAQERKVAVEKFAPQFGIENLDRKQLYKLCMYGFSRDEKIRPTIEARLAQLPAPTPYEKAAIAYTKIMVEAGGPGENAAVEAALREPGTAELLASPDESATVIYCFFVGVSSDKPKMAENLGLAANWLGKTDHLQAWDHGVMTMMYDWGKTEVPNNDKLLAKLRSTFGALDRRTLNKTKLTAEDRPRVELDYESFTGPAWNGKLLGHKSPEINFRWCSDPSVKKLSDYFPGKVVILDFWTTWCQPCVAAFPHIRNLVDHYKGKPVAFLGITSIQGADYDPDGRIDCTGNPDKETGLMPSFMKKRDMTWTVAFSTKDAFDPAFGVHSIPHLAIIDSKGVVRYNELRPEMSEKEFEDYIDALLPTKSN